MKKLSEAYKEQGIDFTFPISIKSPEGRETYYEDGNGFWRKSEYDTNGNWTYYKDSVGDWWKSRFDADSNETYYEDHTDYWRKGEYDAKGNKTYYENSYGDKMGTPRSQMLAEMHEINAELHKEIATLVKDGKRLDWLLNRAYTIQLREGDILTSREDIDREME